MKNWIAEIVWLGFNLDLISNITETGSKIISNFLWTHILIMRYPKYFLYALQNHWNEKQREMRPNCICATHEKKNTSQATLVCSFLSESERPNNSNPEKIVSVVYFLSNTHTYTHSHIRALAPGQNLKNSTAWYPFRPKNEECNTKPSCYRQIFCRTLLCYYIHYILRG